MIPKLRYLLFVFFLLSALYSHSQAKIIQKFKVVFLPQNAGYNVGLLNQELKNSATKQEVVRILKSHPQLFSVPLIIRVINSSTSVNWWRTNPGMPEKEGDFAILQSKAIDNNRFYKTYDVKKYFQDTIVCFDTLKLGMYLQDVNFHIEDYYFKTIDKDLPEEIAIPFDKQNNLLIDSSLFHNRSFIECMLYNKESPADSVAHCRFLFLDDFTKQSLIAIVRELEEAFPGAGTKDIANYLSSYIRANYGKASYPDIFRFLTIHSR